MPGPNRKIEKAKDTKGTVKKLLKDYLSLYLYLQSQAQYSQ